MTRTLFIRTLGDMGLALTAHYAGLLLRFGGFPEVGRDYSSEWAQACLFAAVLLLTSYLSELYSTDKDYGRREILLRIAASVVLAFFLLSGLYFLLPQFMPGRGTLVISLGLFGILQFLWHLASQMLLRIPGMAQKVLIFGAGPLAEQIEKVLAANHHNYVLAGYIRPAGFSPGDADDNGIRNLTVAATRERISKIVVSAQERRGVLPVRDMLGCKLNGIEIVDALSFYEQVTGKLMVEGINPSWFLFSDGTRVTPFMRFYKRLFDIVFAGLGLFLSLPLLPVVALAVKLDSPGPVFFRQVRIGKGGRHFVLFKFRTMCQDAEKQTGAVWAIKNDPRVTRTGSFLRKTRLDEVPQLINVLRGDMSFVGPRPERPEFVRQLSDRIPYYAHRHCVKPGATGWAQVKYPYGASVEDALEKLRYDLYYIKNYSLLLDFMIILETVKVVLFGRGAR